jgi:transposase
MFFAGIDWADDHHDVAVLDQQGHLVNSTRVAHSPAGLAQLKAFLLDIAGDSQQIPCFVETNHGLLISSLLEAGFPVYPLNPKTVDRHRKPAGAKTDAIDAYLLARTGRSDLADLRPLQPDSPLVQELKALSRDLDALIQSQTRLVNQLTACLKGYYPVALELFSKLHQPSTLAFLQAYPTLEAAKGATVEEIALLLRQQRHPQPQRTAARIYSQVRQPQLQADPVTTRTKSRLMLVLVEQLALLVAQIKAYDQEIHRFSPSTRIIIYSVACQEQGNVWHPGCWRNGVMTGNGTSGQVASRPWRAPRPWPTRAAAIARPTSGMLVSSPGAIPSTSSPGKPP